jgi:hypothetical protein
VRSGDAFGLVACDNTVRLDLFEPPSHRLGLADEIRNKLLTGQPFSSQSDASALPFAAQQLRQKRSLVFLISDFHLPDALLTESLTSLALHDVVPLVIWDSAEYRNIPAWGWARVRDMESGGDRSIFLRPSLARQIKESYLTRCQTIITKCLQAGTRPPFFIEDTFNAEQLTRHLLEMS